MKKPTNFIREIIDRDLEAGKNKGRIHTRFPPEPNGYLHIGHAKSICLNFGIAQDYKGLCNLRFDDTNPIKEETEYVKAIKDDLGWLGFNWGRREYYASDYFDKLYKYALELIKKGKAYVCDLSPQEVKKYRGTLTEPGQNSPFRERSVEDNLKLFQAMKKGEFEENTKVLRAKIDMSSPNINLRDPALYRIRKAEHHRTKNKWCIYPMYDFAHCLSDSIEGITHSICTLEFENNRPLYDWIISQLGLHHPQQIEFARLNLSHTVLSKRKLWELVEKEQVSGWDDPRMPTLSGLRRRGYTAASIRNFCQKIGVAKFNSIVDMVVLENTIRQELNKTADRRLAVLDPLKVVITNYPQGKTEYLKAINNPEDPSAGTRKVPFSRELYIEREDFQENPQKKFFRLSPGQEVRLRYAYFITCRQVIKDQASGKIKELHCTYDSKTRGGDSPCGRKVKATLHWVSAQASIEAQVRLYDYLFNQRDPQDNDLNPDSLTILKTCRLEPELLKAKKGLAYQFERKGYFILDSRDSTKQQPVFNRIVSLRDTWAKIAKVDK